MTRQEEVIYIYSLGIKRKKGWQQENNPCLSEDPTDVLKAWTTITKNMSDLTRAELVKKVEQSIQVQTKFREQSRKDGDFVPQPKLMASWLRKGRYNNEIETEEEPTAQEVKTCTECHRPVHGPRFTRCAYHL